MTEFILAVQALAAGYDERRAILSNISFNVRRGELVGLIGANGAGKSTLLKTLNGVLPPLAGTVEILGRATREMTARDFAQSAAYLQQNVAVPFGYSAREIVMVGRYPHLNWWQQESEADESIVMAALEYTGVKEFAERPLHQMSGGQRQRVLLAKVLAQQTPLLFLDEPATGLDIFYQEEIFRYCAALCQAGKTVMMVVHELPLAARFCSRLLLVGSGKIIADGTPSEVLTSDKLTEAYGVAVTVSHNPATGSVEVTTEPPPKGEREKSLLKIILGN